MYRTGPLFVFLFAILALALTPGVTVADGGVIGDGEPNDPFEAILTVEHCIWDLFGATCEEICETVFPLPDEDGWPVWDIPFYGEDVGGGNAVEEVLDHYFE